MAQSESVPYTSIAIETHEIDNFVLAISSNNSKEPQLASNKSRTYPEPPPETPGRFRYSLFVITTYVGLGNCAFFCCLPLLAFENIFRAMGYVPPFSFLCAGLHVPIATCCLCPCVLCKVRRMFRKKRKIGGNALVDCVLSCGLCFCVATQLLTEARAVLLDRRAGQSND
uniref:G-protein coupled receptors family 1 profile domain-containing protein n=1 Tax=Mesocestoides corti TaxID=53468 RepID=A0A5K3FB07_MESCO